ncbi:MAG: hypothetical protein IJE60_10035, partial [Tyzzerella sp.]|nr:hypothetical protein [Tyzzerella sp.]
MKGMYRKIKKVVAGFLAVSLVTGTLCWLDGTTTVNATTDTTNPLSGRNLTEYDNLFDSLTNAYVYCTGTENTVTKVGDADAAFTSFTTTKGRNFIHYN